MSNIVVTADDKDKFYAVRENRNVKGVKYIDRKSNRSWWDQMQNQ